MRWNQVPNPRASTQPHTLSDRPGGSFPADDHQSLIVIQLITGHSVNLLVNRFHRFSGGKIHAGEQYLAQFVPAQEIAVHPATRSHRRKRE